MDLQQCQIAPPLTRRTSHSYRSRRHPRLSFQVLSNNRHLTSRLHLPHYHINNRSNSTWAGSRCRVHHLRLVTIPLLHNPTGSTNRMCMVDTHDDPSHVLLLLANGPFTSSFFHDSLMLFRDASYCYMPCCKCIRTNTKIKYERIEDMIREIYRARN